MKYHDKKINKRPPQFLYKLNPESDRYRICKNCETELMASHRTRIFCDDKCSDEYHNALKRYDRDMKKLNEEIDKQQQLEASEELIEETIETTLLETIEESDETIIKSNISILESLNVDVNGTEYEVEVLDSYGFQFNHYNGRGQLFNIDPSLNCHFTQVGTFRLCRVKYSRILITNLIHK
jgi:hypothetical protein